MDKRFIAGEWDEWMNGTLFVMPNWKWLGLAIAIAAGFLLISLLTKLFHTVKNAAWAKNRATGFLFHFLETDLQKPLAWMITCAFWWVSLDSLSLLPGLHKYLGILVQLIFSINLIVLAFRAAEAVGRLIFKVTSKAAGTTLDNQLAPMATKVLKVLVVILGVLLTVENFGVKVMPFIAGLGLGGLALALAAQDTAANVFGSITIVADRPFRIGDLIKIGETEGVVEEIGFRSTRIRTAAKTLVTIPNSVVAKERVENLQFRLQRRVRHVIGLTYDAKEEQIKSYIRELEAFIKNHPKIDQTNYAIKFSALGDFSLNVLVQFFLFTEDWNEEMAIQEDFLFHAMRAAEKIGVGFAFPTRTQHLQFPKEFFQVNIPQNRS